MQLPKLGRKVQIFGSLLLFPRYVCLDRTKKLDDKHLFGLQVQKGYPAFLRLTIIIIISDLLDVHSCT